MNETGLSLPYPVLVGIGVTVVLYAAILGSLALGRSLGARAAARDGAAAAPSLGSLEGAVFALLGLLIAFTFSGALSRFDERRAQAVNEANAMGTAWLRLDVVPSSAQPGLRETMRAYVDARIATYRAVPDLAAVRQEVARANGLQSRLWREATAATRLPGVPTSAEMLLLPALNEMFDIASTRLAATMMHPPLVIYAMLMGLALAAALLAGYQSAGAGRFGWLHRSGFAVIVALTVYVILDIEYPRLGFVRLDAIDQLLVNVRASMN